MKNHLSTVLVKYVHIKITLQRLKATLAIILSDEFAVMASLKLTPGSTCVHLANQTRL